MDNDSGPTNFIERIDTPESPFLQLPGELRNEVYGYVLEGEHYDVAAPERDDDEKEERYTVRDDTQQSGNRLALVSTCGQILWETNGWHEARSTYHFHDLSDFVSWEPPAGAQSAIIHLAPTVEEFKDTEGDFGIDNLSSDVRRQMAERYASGSCLAIEKLHLDVACKLTPSEIRSLPKDLETIVKSWSSFRIDDLRKRVKEVAPRVKIEISVTHRDKVIYSNTPG